MADTTVVVPKINWWQSRTVWLGVVAVVISAYGTAAATFNLPAIPEFVFGILAALGVYTRVTTASVIK